MEMMILCDYVTVN